MRYSFSKILKSPVVLAIAVIVVAVMLPFLPQFPGVMSAAAPKFGGVIDTTTGKGVPNAIVIVQPFSIADAFFANVSGGCLYRFVTRTDANGDYTVPPTLPTGFGLPFTHARVAMPVRVFKAGFVTDGDEEYIKDKALRSSSTSRSAAKPPATTWKGLWLRIDPVFLQPSELSMREELVYFDGLFRPGSRCFDRGAQEQSIRAEIYDHFASRVCALPPDSDIHMAEALAVMNLSQDIDKFYAVMRNLEGMRWDVNPPFAPHTEPSFLARNICQALHEAGRPA